MGGTPIYAVGLTPIIRRVAEGNLRLILISAGKQNLPNLKSAC
jgi:hypothetical protein